ncbi:MAG: biotin--[acetyl-CoA-carboxylase] ligase [Candidatus Atribacteria bacterium]|nr:biotin--[acetyl-CoA-carboxylase] ligase [Candidatus Atribacteria bacterium]
MEELRRTVLRNLVRAFPGAISGETLAQETGVSRVAVWKSIQTLRELGFPVESSRAGYRLRELPDFLFGPYLEAVLEGTFPNLRVVFYPEIPSTNAEAKKLAEEGYPEGTLVVTENQTQGRGRLGRGWFAERGKSLTVSLVLRPKLEPRWCPSLSLLTALSLAFALEGLGFPVTLKWPNDLYLSGKKVAGVLLESAMEMDRVEWVVVGVGVNVNGESFPPELADRATSLFLAKKEPLPRFQVLQAFLAALGKEYPRFIEEKSFTPWISAFSSRLPFLGKPVEVVLGEKVFQGIAERIDEDGALWVGEHRFPWGEVSLLVNL